MARRVLLDVDATFSLERDTSGELYDYGRVLDRNFYQLSHPTYNVALLEALKESCAPGQVALFSSVDMTQVTAPDARDCFKSHWHVQRNAMRLRFYELLKRAGLAPLGLIPTSSILHKNLYQQGAALMRNELMMARHLKIPHDLSEKTRQRFQPTYGFRSREHIAMLREDFFSAVLIPYVLIWAVQNKHEVISHELVSSCIVRCEWQLKQELLKDFSAHKVLRCSERDNVSEITFDQFWNFFSDWVARTAHDRSAYLENFNVVLIFFSKITVWPEDKKTAAERMRLFYCGKGHMLAHVLHQAAKDEVIQLFDDKKEVIELARILVEPGNQDALGSRKLVALQVNAKRSYHDVDFYRYVLWHTQQSEVWDIAKAEAAFASPEFASYQFDLRVTQAWNGTLYWLLAATLFPLTACYRAGESAVNAAGLRDHKRADDEGNNDDAEVLSFEL